MRTVVEEAQRAASAGGVVDDLSHHRTTVVEEEFVADANLAGRLNEHVPQAHLLVQLAQQEHLNLGIGLLLRSIETGGEYLRVVEDEGVALVEIVEYITEIEVFALDGVSLVVALEEVDGLRLAVQHHELALVATGNAHGFLRAVLVLKLAIDTMRVKRNLLLGEPKLEL